jgi:phospholipid/cholesterol/gamma-HCH transport system substrate-binding protein
MKKISNEVKVGAVAILTIVIFVWLYSFLKGKDFFKNTVNYYSVYDKIGGLAESSPVEINGFKVGVVQSIDLLNEESGKLLVVFSVSKDFKLPRNTIAEITTVSFIAGMKVQFVFGNGPGTYSEGDTIPGRLAESLMSKFETELIPLKDKISKLVDVLDTVINSVNEIMNPEFRKNLNGSLANLNNTSKNLDDIIGGKEKELKATLENISRFSQMLSENSGKMSRTFNNLETITDTLAAADIYNSVLHLKTTLENTSLLVKNMNGGKGSAGQFLTNDTLYTNLTRSLVSLNALLDDMKANPKRYVHFSIFGKRSEPSR